MIVDETDLDELETWVLNDEPLYDWWQRSPGYDDEDPEEFVKDHAEEIAQRVNEYLSRGPVS